MNNSIVSIQPSEWQTMSEMADVLVKSGFLPQSVNTPQKALAIMMVGRELNIPPWQALSTINVIQGKPTVSPQLMLGLANRTGEVEDLRIEDAGDTCTVTIKRKGRAAHIERFTQSDAAAMGLAGKDNWKKQPKIMRRWRCVAAALRVTFPDAILGLYTPEEMGADVNVDEHGQMTVIEVNKPAPPLSIVTASALPDTTITDAEVIDAPAEPTTTEQPAPDTPPNPFAGTNKRWSISESAAWANRKIAEGHSPVSLRKALGIAPGAQWTAFNGMTDDAETAFAKWEAQERNGIGVGK